MKRQLTQILSALLIAVMLIGCAPMGGFGTTASAKGKKITEYNLGDIVVFGSYPQSEVTDEATVSALNSVAPSWEDWTSYGYMSGAGTDKKDGSAQKSDYMRYCDVEYNGARYRGVRFITYRKWYTNYKSNTLEKYTYQHENGYYINTTYWFKYEALQWRVLDPETGLVLCENIIDCQPYSDTLYNYNGNYYKDENHNIFANNYYESSIRKWLNDDFCNTAFKYEEKAQINSDIVRENKAYPASSSKYDSESSADSIFLLTYQDVLNPSYGFSSDYIDFDVKRRAHSTDYAKCQGCYTNDRPIYATANGEDTSHWLLRSAGGYGTYSYLVCSDGYTFYYESVDYSYRGVRPALNFDLTSVITSSSCTEDEPKDVPEYSVPEDLTACYNDNLSSVQLPSAENGKWKWDDEIYTSDTTVGDIGVNYFKANFIPYDTQKYETVYDIDVPVTVLQAKPEFSIPTGLTAKFGQTLADVKLPDTENGKFVWNVKSPEAVKLNKVGKVTQTATYIPNDSNYMTVSDINVYITVVCDHKDCEWIISREPTCDEEGETVLRCPTCGENIQTKPIEKLKSTISSVEIFDFMINYKSTAKVPTNITVDGGAKYTVEYSSDDTKVATVDENGNVYAAKKGSAKITCTVTDSYGNIVTDTCTVNVKYTLGQWLIIILLFGWIWY